MASRELRELRDLAVMLDRAGYELTARLTAVVDRVHTEVLGAVPTDRRRVFVAVRAATVT